MLDISLKPDHPSEKVFSFKKPSNYFFYEVFPNQISQYILMIDY